MKKRIFSLSIALATFSLMAFGYMKWNDPACETVLEAPACKQEAVLVSSFDNFFYQPSYIDLLYKVESRFMTTVTKEGLLNATTIIDILPEEATRSLESYQSVEVTVLHEDREITEMGDNELLNPAQKNLLLSTDYSTNIRITADCKNKKDFLSESEDYDLVYYMTILPEKEAEYINGYDALIEYLRKNSKEQTAIITKDGLKPGRINFTVTKEGTVANVQLDSTSGYPTVDQDLIYLVTNMPGTWVPATNSKGENVDQEFVFFFGLEGC